MSFLILLLLILNPDQMYILWKPYLESFYQVWFRYFSSVLEEFSIQITAPGNHAFPALFLPSWGRDLVYFVYSQFGKYGSYELEPYLDLDLEPMGIKSAFTANADFSNMSNASLCVTMMKQKAKIEVNEDGAKASAVTISMVGDTSPGPVHYEKAEFHANRPFLYFILEESTRSIFFIGTYCGNWMNTLVHLCER